MLFLGGKGLNGYLVVGICIDYEVISVEEVLEKFVKGMIVLVWEGFVFKDLDVFVFILMLDVLVFVVLCIDD